MDDCQWLDRASSQTLGFVARRIQAEGILLAFAAREPSGDLEGIPELLVEGLQDLDARAVLRSVVRWPLDEQVREQILAECRGNRALAAAQAKYLAGAPDAARGLLATAEVGPLEDLERAQVDMIRAQIAYSQNRGGDAPALLLRAARRLEPLDLSMARATYLDAALAGHFAGRLARGSLREAAEAARRVPPTTEPSTPSGLLLDGLATAVTDGYSAGVPALKQAVAGFRGPAATLDEQLRWLWPAAHVAMALWDDESYEVLSARHIEIGREAGVLAVMPTALTTRIVSCVFFGRLTAAEELIEEMKDLTGVIGIPAPWYGPVFVSAWRGRDEAATAAIDTAVQEAMSSGEGAVLAFADYARAVVGNGLGRYEDALIAATATDAFDVEGFTIYTQGLAELVEAAARTGASEQAADGLSRLSRDDPRQRYRLGGGRPGSIAGAAQRG